MSVRFNTSLVSRLYLLLALVAFASALGIGYAIVRLDHDEYRHSIRADVETELDHATEQLQNWLFGFELVASRIESFLALSAEMPLDEVSLVVEDLLEHNPEVFAVALAPGLEISHSFPANANQGIVGLKYWQVPDQMPSVARAFRDRRPILDGPVSLVQGGQGYILRYPVLLPRPGLKADRFWGVISIGISADSLFGAHGHSGEPPVASKYSFGLRELYPSGRPGRNIHGEPSIFESDAVIKEIHMLGSTWQAAARPLQGWSSYSPQSPHLIAFTSIAAVILLIVLLTLRHVTAKGERSHALLREAIDSIDEGFIAFDENDRLVALNQRYLEYYSKFADLIQPGVSFEYLLRRGVERGQYPEALGREEAWIKNSLDRHKNPGAPFLQQLHDGRWIKVTEARTPHGYTVGIRTDVTVEKRAQEAAEAADREKTEFLNNVSHELRTPLTVISGRAAFLHNEAKLPQSRRLQAAITSQPFCHDAARAAVAEYRRHIADQSAGVLTASRHMIRLVEDLLDWARVERGQVELEKGAVQVVDVAKDVVNDLQSEADAKGLVLTYTSDGAAEVMADRIRLTQILYNLVSNAIKFTETGRVHLSVQVEADDVYFTVEDTGCGIPKDHIERIFERFKQVDSSSTRQQGGLGLGLAIARKLADLHDGELSAVSAPGEGSTFRLTLPRLKAAVAKSRSA